MSSISEWSSSSRGLKVQSNLENFLHSVTPVVHTRQLSLKSPEAIGNGVIEYFILEDLWQCYDEWSAYGAGTPVALNHSHETVVQYYTPYLSAIQLFTNREKMREGGSRVSSDVKEKDELFGYPYFQYSETVSPYLRVPFVDKIAEFADNFPGLISLKSIDLSPASWMAVVWSPIYHIPFKGKVEDFSTYFLTFHTLSSCFQDNRYVHHVEGSAKSENKISLPPFGLSTLRMRGEIWINGATGDYEKLINLHSAADSWLKQLQFHHYDFDYYHKKNQELTSIYN